MLFGVVGSCRAFYCLNCILHSYKDRNVRRESRQGVLLENSGLRTQWSGPQGVLVRGKGDP